MLAVHHANAFLVIALCATAGVGALIARGRGAGKTLAHLLALAQTLVVAQVLLGLLLLADHKRAADRLHYAYGTFSHRLPMRRPHPVPGCSISASQACSPRRSGFAPT
jgi:hypothetical protein